jgi:hypothetical protein
MPSTAAAGDDDDDAPCSCVMPAVIVAWAGFGGLHE